MSTEREEERKERRSGRGERATEGKTEERPVWPTRKNRRSPAKRREEERKR